MKWLYVLTILSGFAPLARATAAGTYVPVAAEALFVPRGFDDNDDIVVSLAGNFPNTCYQLANVELKTDGKSSRIVVQQMAFVVPGPCSRMLVPFTNTVHLGRLARGNYVVMGGGTQLQVGLPVTQARIPTQDDYLYAPLTSASVIPSGGRLVAVLQGRRTNSCLKPRTIEATYTGATVQVLPIMELRSLQDDGRPCRTINEPLRLMKTLTRLNVGRYLLHVRSLNGQSLNVVFNVDN